MDQSKTAVREHLAEIFSLHRMHAGENDWYFQCNDRKVKKINLFFIIT